MLKIENPDQPFAVVRRPNLDMPQKLSIIEYVWGEKLAWNTHTYELPLFRKLDQMLKASNQDFIDDMVRYGRPVRDYVRDLWYKLLAAKEMDAEEVESEEVQAA